MGGSPTMTLSTGVGSVCINIKEEGDNNVLIIFVVWILDLHVLVALKYSAVPTGFLHIEDCEVTTETSVRACSPSHDAHMLYSFYAIHLSESKMWGFDQLACSRRPSWPTAAGPGSTATRAPSGPAGAQHT
jgi:hypothetical protein